MLDKFLNQTCDINENSITMSGGEQIKSKVNIYAGIKGYYYKQRASSNDTGLSENTDLNNYRVILEADKTLVRQNMEITITDSDLGEVGTFIIKEVKVNRLIDGSNDSIQLNVNRI